MEKIAVMIADANGKVAKDTVLLGKTLVEWIRTACPEAKEILLGQDPIAAIKEGAKGSEFAVVYFSDTPLITTKTLDSTLKAVQKSKSGCIRLLRGYAFRTSSLGKLHSLEEIDETSFFAEEAFLTVTGYKQLAMAEDLLRGEINDRLMDSGVRMIDPSTTYIDASAKICLGVTIYPNNRVEGCSVVESGAVLKPNNMLKNTVIGQDAVIWASSIEDSEVGKGTTVGPFSYIRNHTKLGEGCRVGDYVEIKNSVIGSGTKMAHLTYVGDAKIGSRCNIGCGVIFANYDGKNKSETTVGDKVFIGSNCNLVAPVVIEDRAFIAAGTTVTKNVPSGMLAIGRSRQEHKAYQSKYLADDEKNKI